MEPNFLRVKKMSFSFEWSKVCLEKQTATITLLLKVFSVL